MIDVHPLGALFRRWSGHSDLSQADKEALLSLPFTRKTYGKDAYIVREGRAGQRLRLLLKGFAFRQKLLRDGSRQIISFHIPERIRRPAEQPAGGRRPQRSEPQPLRGRARAAQRTAASSPTRARRSGMAMWIDTLDRCLDLPRMGGQCRPARLSRRALPTCCASSRSACSRTGPERDGMFDFPMTQEQLADATGLTSVHTNRTLQSLRKDGLIQLTARSLTVLDWDGLRAVGDFDELYLHQHLPALKP